LCHTRLPLHRECGANCERAIWPLRCNKSISTAARLAKAGAAAEREGAPRERVVQLYEALIESSIAYEFESFDSLRR
jgi:hypothetical protein